MARDIFGFCGATTFGAVVLGGVLGLAQAPAGIAPLRTAPVEQFTIHAMPGASGATDLVLEWEGTSVAIPITRG